MPIIRISRAAQAELRRRAAEEDRTMTVVMDRLLGLVPRPSRRARAYLSETEAATLLRRAGAFDADPDPAR